MIREYNSGLPRAGKLATAKLFLFTALFFFFLKVEGQRKILITVVDCVTLEPIQDVALLTPSGSIIGMSDSNGTASIPHLSSYNVTFSKLGYETSYETNITPSHYCMKMLSLELDEVHISDFKSNQRKLNEFVEKASSNLLTSKTTVFYSFSYKTSYLKHNRQETIEGIVKVILEPYSKRFSSMGGGIFFCEMNLEVDSDIWFDMETERFNSLSTLLKIWEDPMRKSAYLQTHSYRNCDIQYMQEDSSMIFKLNSETKNIKSEGDVKFLLDSSIHSFFNQIEKLDKNYYSVRIDSISYQARNNQFFTYRFLREIFQTDQGLVNSSIELRFIPEESYNSSFCDNIPYGYIFDYKKSVEDSIIEVTLK